MARCSAKACSPDTSPTAASSGARRCIRWWRHAAGRFRWWERRLARPTPASSDLMRRTISAPFEGLTGTLPGDATTAQAGPGRTFSLAMPCWAACWAWRWSPAPDRRRPGRDHAGGGGVARSLLPLQAEILQFAFDRQRPTTPNLPAQLSGDRCGGFIPCTHDNGHPA